MRPDPKPVAYVQGMSGPLVHVNCWDDHNAEVLARTHWRAFLGAIIYEGHPRLKTARCGFCGKPMSAHTTEAKP